MTGIVKGKQRGGKEGAIGKHKVGAGLGGHRGTKLQKGSKRGINENGVAMCTGECTFCSLSALCYLE